MNYFAHAIRHLDRPHFLAGLAVPDWLSVVDRGVRVRSRQLVPLLDSLLERDREIAAGILQHLDDDQWFHGTAAFHEVTGDIAALFRRSLAEAVPAGAEDPWPYGFLGHLLLELLIDATLAQRFPGMLDAYYQAMEAVEGERVSRLIERATGKPVPNMAYFIHLYRQERFLFDYLDNDRLLHRVNQVMRRVTLPPLPRELLPVLTQSRSIVEVQLERLLPESSFGTYCT